MPGARVPATLVLDVRGRRGERWLSALTLLAVACSALLLPFPPLQAALFFTVAALTVLAGLWWHGWLGGARRLVQLNWLADGRWLLADAGQGGFPAILSRHCRVGSRWLWLHWHIDGPSGVRGPRRRSMLLLQGDIAAAELRRLGVRLRLDSVFRQPTRALTAGT
jgi:hypothetical protein